MPFRQHVSHDEITALHQAAVALGLANSRADLLDGIAPAFATTLRGSSNPSTQVYTDLHTMNTVEILTDGTVPLHIWLTNARNLSAADPRSAIFQTTLARLAPNAAPPPPPISALVVVPIVRPAPRAPTAALPASAAFISLADLKSLDGPEIPAALSALHRVLHDSIAPLALPEIRILSSLTGAIVLVPDALNRNLHDLLPTWLRALATENLAVRAGVSRSLVELIPDADGTLNAIGRSINIAARLATSPQNPGVLYDEPYTAHVQDMVGRAHALHRKKRSPLQIKGKRGEVFTCFADPDIIPCPATTVALTPNLSFSNAVLLAYDLPDFSDGDLRTLTSRFRAVVHEVQRLREEHSLVDGAKLSFSPGGDGGVFAITQVPLGRAFGLATELASLLEAANTTQSGDAPVRARIGIHYGQVFSYTNAEGTARPTGFTLFDADALAGDDEARRYDAVIVSGALIESASDGARKVEGSRFKEIAPLTTGHETTIKRFVPREAPRRADTVALANQSTKLSLPEPTTMTLQLNGSDYEQLTTALTKAFPTRSRLERMLQFRLSKDLNELAGENLPIGDAIFEVIRDANAQGWTLQLIAAARASSPGNPQLFVFCQTLGLAPATPSQPALERLVAKTNSFLDINKWRTRLGEIEAQVCRVEVGRGARGSFGTGFLVGPDLMITNHHVLESVIAGKLDPTEVIFRFDYKRLAAGNVVNPGTEHALAKDWLVDSSPSSDTGGDPGLAELDYALVRLARRAGEEPVGQGAEPGAPKRTWIVPAAQHDFTPHTPLFIVQHPKAATIKVAFETDAIVGFNGSGTRVRYRTNTEPGSSGSPCFDQSWNLVALHSAGGPDQPAGDASGYNLGIPFTKIVAHLRRSGVGVELPPLPE